MSRVTVPYWIQALNSRVGLNNPKAEINAKEASDVSMLKSMLEMDAPEDLGEAKELNLDVKEVGRGCDLSYTFQQLHSQLEEMREEQE